LIRSRCEEIDRDPATLAVSVHIWAQDISRTGAERVDRLAAFRELGVSRVMGSTGPAPHRTTRSRRSPRTLEPRASTSAEANRPRDGPETLPAHSGGMVGTLFGVDVSPSQGTVDWAKVKAAGISFAVARCLRETGAIDGAYQRNVAGARAAGLVPGAYAFLVGGTASQQAKSFIDAVGDPTGMLIMLDVERPTVAANPVPTAADVKAFVAAWKAAHPAHPILIYGSSGSVLGTIGKTTDLHQLGPLWLAWYRKGHTHTASGFYASLGGNDAKQWSVKFGGWPGATIWQFTDGSVRVSGIQKPDGTFLAVDLNAFRGRRPSCWPSPASPRSRSPSRRSSTRSRRARRCRRSPRRSGSAGTRR
jgi:GH25 family lysozyme M1 (1,4-beta-N-acetylmuramidase)